jgi:hypothetical protein
MNQPDTCDSIPRFTFVVYERCILQLQLRILLQRELAAAAAAAGVDELRPKERGVTGHKGGLGAESTAVILKFSVENVAALMV